MSVIPLPKILDYRGNLSFLEGNNQIPFTIKRVHWLYDVPGGEIRGGLAYKTTEEFAIALSGSIDISVDDGERVERVTLNRSYMGLYIPKGLWRFIDNVSTNAVVLIVASTLYDPDDAIRDYTAFLSFRGL